MDHLALMRCSFTAGPDLELFDFVQEFMLTLVAHETFDGISQPLAASFHIDLGMNHGSNSQESHRHVWHRPDWRRKYYAAMEHRKCVYRYRAHSIRRVV